MFPIVPKLSIFLNKTLFKSDNFVAWPEINSILLEDDKISLPIQIHGKLVAVVDNKRGYLEEDILDKVCQIEKNKNKIEGKEIKKIVNVQDKIINIITS